MGSFNIWCFIIPLIAAILGAILGWLLRGSSSSKEVEETVIDNGDAEKIAKLKADLEACRTSKSKISNDLDACRSSKTKLSSDLDACLASKAELSSNTNSLNNAASAGLGFAAASINDLSASEPELSFDANAAKLALGKKIIADDLKIIEGIGPKIAQLFNENGVNTWYQLSKTPIERCQEILNLGGKRYEIHNPGTWPKQSGLAFEGKWKELNDLQDYLDGGVEPKN